MIGCRSRRVVLPAPQLFEPAVAAASRAVEFVAQRVLQIIVLMIILGRPKRRGGHDLGHDRLLETAGFAELGLRDLGETFLLLVVKEDRAAILIAVIAELRVGGHRIDVVPKRVEQLRVADLAGVVLQLDRFGMAGRAGGDLLIRRILLGAAGISDGDRDDAVELVERRFHAPETAAGEGRSRELGLCPTARLRTRSREWRAQCSKQQADAENHAAHSVPPKALRSYVRRLPSSPFTSSSLGHDSAIRFRAMRRAGRSAL